MSSELTSGVIENAVFFLQGARLAIRRARDIIQSASSDEWKDHYANELMELVDVLEAIGLEAQGKGDIERLRRGLQELKLLTTDSAVDTSTPNHTLVFNVTLENGDWMRVEDYNARIDTLIGLETHARRAGGEE